MRGRRFLVKCGSDWLEGLERRNGVYQKKFSKVVILALLFLTFGLVAPVNGQTTADTDNPPDAGAYLTEFMVRSITPPRRDDYALYSRLKQDLGPNPARSTTKRTYQIGDKDTFWVLDQERVQYYQVTATLVAMTPHVYMFLDDKYKVNVNALKTAADAFESRVYPTTRRYFGEEASPGVDNDPHLVILNTTLKQAAGYFSAEDTLLQSVNPYSNEREMFYAFGQPEALNGYLSLLAHEFQHMIEHNSLPNQDNWLNEGSSVLSQKLNGFSSDNYEQVFMNLPNTQLNAWNCTPCGSGTIPYYGAGYTWLSYLNDRLGFEVIRNIAGNGQGLTGFNSVDYALAAAGHPELTGDSVFKQFVVANYMNRRTADPLYSYKSLVSQVNRVTAAKAPFSSAQNTVNQYAAQYFDVTSTEAGFTLDFNGQATTRLAPVAPHGGKMVWWANRGDYSNTTLTREVDLSNVKQATFKFWTWFDIEPNYDYLYIEASRDGQKWEPLSGKYTTAPKATSRAYGPAFTGQSNPGAPDLTDQEDIDAGWVQESVDLSKYAGQKIKLRLEYVTDEGYNRNGALFDDFEIPEIGWRDDAESSVNGWQANGFLRVNNLMPQRYFVQVISRDGACADPKTTDLSKADNGQSCIQDVTLDNTNAGRKFFPYKRAMVIVAPYAPRTLVPAQFSLNITPGK